MNAVTWVLIVFAHVGPLAETDSNSLTSIPGFVSKQECTEAGEASRSMAKNTMKVIKFVCVKQSQPASGVER